MINIIQHEGTKHLNKIERWAKQFGSTKVIDVKDMPIIEKGIFLLVDLPIRPTSKLRILNPKTEKGQVEAAMIYDFFIPYKLEIPLICFGGYSIMEMLGCKLESTGKKQRPYLAKVMDTKGISYSVKSRLDWRVTEVPSNIYVHGSYSTNLDPVILTTKKVWCCNALPHLFENRSSSFYKKRFGWDLGDPISNNVIKKVYEADHRV